MDKLWIIEGTHKRAAEQDVLLSRSSKKRACPRTPPTEAEMKAKILLCSP